MVSIKDINKGYPLIRISIKDTRLLSTVTKAIRPLTKSHSQHLRILYWPHSMLGYSDWTTMLDHYLWLVLIDFHHAILVMPNIPVMAPTTFTPHERPPHADGSRPGEPC
jgi:hypothetical protein